ncbi:MAG: site-specific DNA-methyltransferase [Chloroflexota bacterium]|nr:site-specific DNA-methyltransferase [Chloroflexota bacterium]
MAEAPQDYERVELVWPGKRTEVERVRLPFQVIERVNDVRRSRERQAPMLTGATDLPDWWPEGWRNKLIWGDNKYVLASLLEEFAGKVDLIYIDPPFNTGTDFSYETTVGDTSVEKLPTLVEELAYRDTWREGVGSYCQMMYDRLVLAHELVAPSGCIYVHCDPTAGHFIRALLDEIFGQHNFRNEIVWAYTGPSNTKEWFPRKHDTIFFYVKDRTNTRAFNRDAVRVPYKEGSFTMGGGGSLARRNKPDTDYLTGAEEALKRGKVVEDYWTDIPSLSVSSERVGYDTQKPKALLDRIIKASSATGGLVLDFFAGSGTTLVAAEQLGRRWIGVDLGRFAVQTTRKRLLEIPECRPFEVQNLGRYERRYWQGTEAGEAIHDYYRFILELYGARPIAGFTHLHGERDGRFVHVGATDAPVTLDELDRTIEECAANGLTAVDVLGWEWVMGLNPAGKDELAAKHQVDVRLFHIPREAMDKRAVEAGDVRFFELSVIEVVAHTDRASVEVELAGFLPAVDDYMRQKVSEKVTRWSDWIDYWSIDFAFDGETFLNQWQAYRTRKEPKLTLRSDPHTYEDPGEHGVVVKVIDIFGNDTTHELRVTVEP